MFAVATFASQFRFPARVPAVGDRVESATIMSTEDPVQQHAACTSRSRARMGVVLIDVTRRSHPDGSLVLVILFASVTAMRSDTATAWRPRDLAGIFAYSAWWCCTSPTQEW
jgi:hypothetical protein